MPEIGPHIRLAIPLAAQQLGFQLMGTVDAALLGRFDDTSLAAAGVGNNLLFAITSIGMGIVMGLDTVVPQALGAGKRDDARRLLGAGLRLAVIVGLVATVAVLAMPLVLRVADVPADVRAEATLYVYLRALGIVPFLVSVAMRSYLAAHGVTRPLVIAVVAGNLANAVLDVVLIFGIGPIPPFGIAGAAVATITAQLATLFIYFAAVRAVEPATHARATPADRATILHYGLPVGGQMFAEVGIFGVATILAAHLGKLPVAAHSIALNFCSFSFAVAVGVGSATSVRVGHAIGAGDRVLARRRGLTGLRIGLAIMAVFAVVLVALPRAIAGIFTNDTAVIDATVPLLLIAAVFQLSDGTQAIAAGALRGLGDTHATLYANLVGHYAIGLGISLGLCFGVGLGVIGLWWGLSAGLTATAAFLVLRFLAATADPATRSPAGTRRGSP